MNQSLLEQLDGIRKMFEKVPVPVADSLMSFIDVVAALPVAVEQKASVLDKLNDLLEKVTSAPARKKTPVPVPAEKTRLEADPARSGFRETGVYIRAWLANEKDRMGAVDLAHLTARSAVSWLEREGGLATRTLLILLGHPRNNVDEAMFEAGVQKKEADLRGLLRAAITDLIEPMGISHLTLGTHWREVADEFSLEALEHEAPPGDGEGLEGARGEGVRVLLGGTVMEVREVLASKSACDLQLSVRRASWTCSVSAHEGSVIRTVVADGQIGPDEAFVSALSALGRS